MGRGVWEWKMRIIIHLKKLYPLIVVKIFSCYCFQKKKFKIGVGKIFTDGNVVRVDFTERKVYTDNNDL